MTREVGTTGTPEWQQLWAHARVIGLRDAACVLAGDDPHKLERIGRGYKLSSSALTLLTALRQAVAFGELPAFEAWEVDDFGDAKQVTIDQIDPHTALADSTTIEVTNLAEWCDAHGIRHLWRHDNTASRPPIDHYPAELRAALEAFDAVHDDPTALRGKSPKAALTAWLKMNRPDLSANARERIATVANWQPTGGAPTTPEQAVPHEPTPPLRG